MGFIDKIMFWKSEEPALGKDFGEGLPPFPGESQGPAAGLDTPTEGFGASRGGLGLERADEYTPQKPFNPQPAFSSAQQPQQHQPDMMMSKNMEVISSKLDALQASMDSINQRLVNIERIAYSEQQESHRRSQKLW